MGVLDSKKEVKFYFAINQISGSLTFFQAYEEVHIFFSSSSIPPVLFSDLMKSLDTKLQAIEAFSAFVKELSVGRLKRNNQIALFACLIAAHRIIVHFNETISASITDILRG